MENNVIKVIDSFEIKGMGLLTEIQHNLEGIPPNTNLIDGATENSWIVKKRVFHGVLLKEGAEVSFDCETEITHVDAVFSDESKRAQVVKEELDKQKKCIYHYLLKPVKKGLQTRKKKKQVIKPATGSMLKIAFS